MELHPILDKNCKVNEKMWYVLSAVGDSPTMRVGHTCSYILDKENQNGKVYVIGGANPDGCFADVYVLNLDTFSWDIIDSTGMKARYEHSSLVSEKSDSQIYIFGGADQSHNFNDIQMFDAIKSSWRCVEPRGTKPVARTYHTSATSSHDSIYVYSGGQSCSDPVGDRQVHVFNITSNEWITLNTKGEPPKPRHGHVVLKVDKTIYIHGGMAGTTFYDDFHSLNLDSLDWKIVKKNRKTWPSARAGHGGVTLSQAIYIFGGMNREGALDDLYKFDIVSNQWSKLVSDGPPPAPRLDFGCCIVRLQVPETDTQSNDEVLQANQQAQQILDGLRIGSASSARSLNLESEMQSQILVTSEKEETTSENEICSISNSIIAMDLLLVHGGMDTEGHVYDDCLVYLLNSITLTPS